jgi:predicted nucleic acid-binding protein
LIAYLDASALLKLILDEPGSDRVRELWDSELAVAASELAVVELACALAAAVRARRLAASALGRPVIDGTFLMHRAELVAVGGDVVRSASLLGARHGLRALDAVHVASALVLREAAPTLVSFDRDQRRAAVREGLPVYPEGRTAALR